MGTFLIKKTATGYNFRFVSGNGQTVCVSEVYKLLPSCQNGIKSVRVNAPLARIEDQTQTDVKALLNPKFEIYKSKNNEYRFRLRARNGQIIAASEGYKTLTGCEEGIEYVRKSAPDAEIINPI